MNKNIFINIIAAGTRIKSTFKTTGITLWSVHKKRPKRYLFKLNNHHAKWVINFIDDKSTAVLDQVNQALCEAFEHENLLVNGSALHRFMGSICALSTKGKKVQLELLCYCD